MSDLRGTIENAAPGRRKWPWIAGVVVLVLLVTGEKPLTTGLF